MDKSGCSAAYVLAVSDREMKVMPEWGARKINRELNDGAHRGAGKLYLTNTRVSRKAQRFGKYGCR